MPSRHKSVIQGGRVVLPSSYRKSLGLKEGDEVLLELGEGEIRIVTAKRALERAQAILRRFVPKKRSLAEELIAERRGEAADD